MEHTLLKRMEQHKDRWSSFGSGTGITVISEKLSAEELKGYDIFKEFDTEFLEQISPDVSVAMWKKDSVLFEEGTYIDLAFYIAEGSVVVYVSRLQGEKEASQPIFSPDQGPPDTESSAASTGTTTLHYQQTQRLQVSKELTFLSTMDFDLPIGDKAFLGKGEIFGEIGALNGWPMSTTVKTESDCLLVQIRVPALRKMKKRSTEFREKVDTVYRQRALLGQLRASPLFRHCSEVVVGRLAENVDLVSCEPDEVVVKEGVPADAVYLVRSGFMKLSRRQGAGQRVLSYVSKGMTFGEIEFLLGEMKAWRFTVSSVGYCELVKIPKELFSQILVSFPQIERELWHHAVDRIKECGASQRSARRSEFVEFSLEKGLVEGNSILVIDLNACTRCDDCVRACAETHGGRPRFVREGDKYDNLLITKACYHCQDPVCLIGCPTGAIRRANVGEVVEIREDICIGCSNCAENCVYDAIVMHDTQTRWGPNALPKSLRGEERFLASKCDLCYTLETGPACVRNCPQRCAFRVSTTQEFQQLLNGGPGR